MRNTFSVKLIFLVIGLCLTQESFGTQNFTSVHHRLTITEHNKELHLAFRAKATDAWTPLATIKSVDPAYFDVAARETNNALEITFGNGDRMLFSRSSYLIQLDGNIDALEFVLAPEQPPLLGLASFYSNNQNFSHGEAPAEVWSVQKNRSTVLAVSSRSSLVYAGPADPITLSDADPGLEGIQFHFLWGGFALLCELISSALGLLFELTGNWGASILLLALLVRLIFFPINKTSESLQREVDGIKAQMAPDISAAKQLYSGEELHFKILEIREKYDFTTRKELSPLFAFALQIPVLIAVFNVLAVHYSFNSVSFLWISNLALANEIYSLPFSLPFIGNQVNLLPFCMFFVSTLSTALFNDKDLAQSELKSRKLRLHLMNFAFLVLFYSFPSAMVLYWTAVNFLQLLQQQYSRLFDS
jgi:YidC/Oxa1 family membrane protein insertase